MGLWIIVVFLELWQDFSRELKIFLEKKRKYLYTLSLSYKSVKNSLQNLLHAYDFTQTWNRELKKIT